MSQIIESGSYGTVHIDNYTVKKIIEKFIYDKYTYLEYTSLKESVILSMFPIHRGFATCHFVIDKRDKIYIKMSNCGVSLDKWVKSLHIKYRMEKIYCIFFQLIQILSSLEKCDIIHGDIKPSNILIDKDKISIIDYGACILDTTIVSIIKETSRFNMCTYWFSSPEMLNINFGDSLSPKHDIFSVGMILKYIIDGEYVKDSDVKIKYCKNDNLDVSHLKNTIYEYMGDKSEIFYNTLCKILTIDNSKRPYATEIISMILPIDYKYLSYTMDPCFLMDRKFSVDLDNINRTKCIEWCYCFFKMYDLNYLLSYVFHIFDYYNFVYNVDEKEYKVLLCSSILIADSIINTGCLTLDFLLKFVNIKENIKVYIFKILSGLKYRVYSRTFDYKLRKEGIDIEYSIVKDILLSNDNLSIDEKCKLYYTMIHEKKNTDISN